MTQDTPEPLEARFKRADGLYLWDRLEGESGKAYDGFCLYRDLGRGRSVDAAYWQTKQCPPDTPSVPGRQPPGRWKQWSSEFDWPARATAYDLYLELLTRREREAKHLTDIDQYRERMRAVAAATIQAGMRLLERATKRLVNIEPDAIQVKDLPAFFRAAAAVIETASAAEAQALAVDQLLAFLDTTDDG